MFLALYFADISCITALVPVHLQLLAQLLSCRTRMDMRPCTSIEAFGGFSLFHTVHHGYAVSIRPMIMLEICVPAFLPYPDDIAWIVWQEKETCH